MNFPFHTTLFLLLSSSCFSSVLSGENLEADVSESLLRYRTKSSHVFSVRSFGARANGLTDDSNAFLAAWRMACGSAGLVTFLIPKGTYLVGPVKFSGPCKNVSSLTVKMKGYLKASTDLSKYGSGAGWIEFRWMEGLTLTGGGTFDGQGAEAWPFNNCLDDYNCKLLPTNLKFVAMNNTVVQHITSLDSKFFHLALVQCKRFRGSKLMISAPANSPNTDGIHIDRSYNVHLSQSRIQTGDDCISIGQGNSQVTVSSINCGPGHGISVGSLGRYRNEGDVNGLVVKNCSLTGTTNGIRIKTWPNSPGSSSATNMTFENITMNNVSNPIIIDQSYCPFRSCSLKAPSLVKLSDIYFKNIRGTSSSKVAVALECSKGIPCQNVNLENVHLNLSSGENHPSSTCKYVRARYIGTQVPPPCA
ncbi:exopolygalacturonase isoform X1 [Benincasa hispida]|uniref:exopolygalacturonase isoform X1 n=2 Tax=Benincasa hispida TaxID=102211 RepID=UPI00190299F6|nr:exopolygalacturonase isoform X1 [Benincasa hispida]